MSEFCLKVNHPSKLFLHMSWKIFIKHGNERINLFFSKMGEKSESNGRYFCSNSCQKFELEMQRWFTLSQNQKIFCKSILNLFPGSNDDILNGTCLTEFCAFDPNLSFSVTPSKTSEDFLLVFGVKLEFQSGWSSFSVHMYFLVSFGSNAVNCGFGCERRGQSNNAAARRSLRPPSLAVVRRSPPVRRALVLRARRGLAASSPSIARVTALNAGLYREIPLCLSDGSAILLFSLMPCTLERGSHICMRMDD